ncbi:MAG TPA: hypothetical protein VMI30_11120 [Stellaceae bacterium]|nr:hypothetical protein [Stellaceae bacterium]
MTNPPSSKFHAELIRFASLDKDSRIAVLAMIAHDLTVGIRSALLDLPSPEAAKKIRALNEYIHQITGRIHTSDELSGNDESDLLRDVAYEADAKSLTSVVERRLGPAIRHITTHAESHEMT